MKTIYQLIILLIQSFLIISQAKFKPQIKTLTEIESDLKNIREQVFGIFGSGTSDDFIQKVYKDTQGLVQLFISENNQFQVDQLSLLGLKCRDLSQNSNIIQISKQNYEIKTIVEFIEPDIKGNIMTISHKEFQQTLGFIVYSQQKFPVVLFKDINDSKKYLAFKLLSMQSQYQENFQFVEIIGIYEEMKPALEQLKITKLPSALIFLIPPPEHMEKSQEENSEQRSLSAAQIRGPLSYNFIEANLKGILSNERLLELIKNKKKEEKAEEQKEGKNKGKYDSRPGIYPGEIEIISKGNEGNLLDQCDKQLCFLIFEKLQMNSDEERNKTKKEAQFFQTHFVQKEAKFFLIDAVCYQELLLQLNLSLDFLPAIIGYKGKESQYYQMAEKYSQDAGYSFARKVKNNMIKPVSLLQKLVTTKKDCEKENESLRKIMAKEKNKEEKVEDEIMREVLEEQRKKEEAWRKQEGQRKRRRRDEDL